MPEPDPVVPYPCASCPRLLTAGRVCGACRLRKCRGSTVEGAACRVPGCDAADPRVLRRHRFDEGVRVLCANHDALAGRRPRGWAAFLDELAAEPIRRSA
jgi:hypothetical protein